MGRNLQVHLRPLPIFTAVTLLLALAGCGTSSSNSPPPTNAVNARSDATLQAAAAQAWSDAGYTGQSAATLDTGNTDALGSAADDTIGSAFDGASTNHGISSPAALASAAIPLGMLAQRAQSLVTALEPPLAAPQASTVTVMLNETITSPTPPCTSNGSVIVSGQISATADTGVATISADNVLFTFQNCANTLYEITGSILLNEDVSVTAIQTGQNSANLVISFDVYQDGGLAIHDLTSGLYYNPIFRNTLLGSITIVINNNAFAGVTGSVRATRQLNNVTCTATMDKTDVAAPLTGTFSCTAS